MIRLFYGDDRLKLKEEAKKILGENYEVLEGVNIQISDMPSIFYGASLFNEKRAILITDLGENLDAFEKLDKYLDTPHEVVLVESRLDKRTVAYKAIKDKIKIQEFKNQETIDPFLAFNIMKTAKKDGARAVKMLEEIEEDHDPMMILGAFVSQAIRDYSAKQGTKEKRVLEELSKLDLLMKSSSIQPFSLLKSFLLQVSLL
jgi:DNA polymerase III delta subunit